MVWYNIPAYNVSAMFSFDHLCSFDFIMHYYLLQLVVVLDKKATKVVNQTSCMIRNERGAIEGSNI